MTIKILTLFPEMFDALKSSVIGRAQAKEVVRIEVIDIRAYSKDKHAKCDDTPFGGGAGMVMTPQPIFDAVNAADPQHTARRIYLSAKGQTFTSALARELACQSAELLLLCGHYEGVDQRVLELCGFEELSIGDYVLTGGELPAMVVTDALLRFVPQVLGCSRSAEEESFCDGLLEYPQYTRPQVFRGLAVPDVLLSGHHERIEQWRREQSLLLTRKQRPDLLEEPS